MGLGVSLILIAVGAILIWAVDVTTNGVNIHAVGVVLLDRRSRRRVCSR